VETVGCGPFDLLFGRSIAGPLSVIPLSLLKFELGVRAVCADDDRRVNLLYCLPHCNIAEILVRFTNVLTYLPT